MSRDDAVEMFPAARQPGRKLEPKQCLSNALEMAQLRPGLAYAEGIAKGYLGLWYEHAWNVNAAGEVVDYTWKEPGTRYLGRVIDAREKWARTLAVGRYQFDRPLPFVPDGEAGADCFTREADAWLREHGGGA